MRRAELAAFLRERCCIGDGGVGTALYNGGVAARGSFDDLNRSDPERNLGIHAAHLAAGAEVISTNSFRANRWKLARHGLSSEMAANNAAGVAVARRAANSDIVVLRSVGPSGEILAPLAEEKAPAMAAGVYVMPPFNRFDLAIRSVAGLI